MVKIGSIEKLLRDIGDTLRHLERRLDRLERRATRPPTQSGQSYVPGPLWSLPEHLRKSMETITLFGEATAHEVAEKTGRSRAAESDYLNQLVDHGFLKKERRGKEVVFQVFNLHTICTMCGCRVPITAKYCNLCGEALVDEEHVLARVRRTRF